MRRFKRKKVSSAWRGEAVTLKSSITAFMQMQQNTVIKTSTPSNSFSIKIILFTITTSTFFWDRQNTQKTTDHIKKRWRIEINGQNILPVVVEYVWDCVLHVFFNLVGRIPCAFFAPPKNEKVFNYSEPFIREGVVVTRWVKPPPRFFGIGQDTNSFNCSWFWEIAFRIRHKLSDI